MTTEQSNLPTVDEMSVMMALTMLIERGLLPGRDATWVRGVIAERTANGVLTQATLAQAASLINRHGAIAAEHGIPVPELPGARTPEPRDTGAPRPGATTCEINVAPSGELIVTGTPYEMREILKTMPGHRYSRSEKAWYLTAAPAVAAMMGTIIQQHHLPLAMGPKAKALAIEHTKRRETAQILDPDAPVPDLDWQAVSTKRPWEHQLRGAEFMMRSSAALIGAPMGPQPVDTPVLTPKGWRQLGDLAPGDEVYGSDGRAKPVVDVRHYGPRPVYRVDLSDGTSTRCTAEHRWSVHRYSDLQGGRHRSRTVTTHEMIEDGVSRPRCERPKWYLPSQPIVENDQLSDPGPVPCYTLGAYLGDGSMGPTPTVWDPEESTGRELSRECARFGVRAVRVSGGRGWRLTKISGAFGAVNPLTQAMRDLGLPSMRSGTKRVPASYLTGSTEARRAVLQGLMDTDGHANHGNRGASYCTTSSGLADDVAYLVRSLGGRAIVAWREAASSFVVEMRFWDSFIPFRMPRKRAAYGQSSRRPWRTIDAIADDGIAEVCCIEVESDDHVYLTDSSLIPTHNSGKTSMSFLALNLMEAQRVLVVCPNRVRPVWNREAGRHSVREWHIVDGRRRSGRARSGWVDLQVDERLRQGEEALFDCSCGRPHMWCINYEILSNDVFDGWAPRSRFDAILYDEVHRLGAHATRTKSGGTSVSGRAASWVDLADHRWGLSGTPLGTEPAETLFSVYRALDPGIFGVVWDSNFREADGKPRGHSQRYQMRNPQNQNHVIGYVNLADLARKASTIMYRPVVQLDLPPSTTETVEVELDARTMKAYREMETELVTDLAEFIDPASASAVAAERDRLAAKVYDRAPADADAGLLDIAVHAAGLDSEDMSTETVAKNPMVKLLRLQQLTGGVLCTDDGVEARVWDTGKNGTRPSPKGDALADVLESVGCHTRNTAMNPDSGELVEARPEPVVVMCRFSSDLAQVREVAEARGLVYGEISGRRSDGLTRDATMSPDIDICGVQIQAGGTGIELVRARIVVWWSVGYSLVDFDQAVKRCHRPGQTRPVLNIHLVATGTADEAVYSALSERRSTVATVYRLAGFSDEAVDQLSAATRALGDEHVDTDDASTPDAPELISDLHGSEGVDLPYLDQAEHLGNGRVYKPRKRTRRTGAPTSKGRGRRSGPPPEQERLAL